jgi:hypothetical protein
MHEDTPRTAKSLLAMLVRSVQSLPEEEQQAFQQELLEFLFPELEKVILKTVAAMLRDERWKRSRRSDPQVIEQETQIAKLHEKGSSWSKLGTKFGMTAQSAKAAAKRHAQREARIAKLHDECPPVYTFANLGERFGMPEAWAEECYRHFKSPPCAN